MKLRNVLTGAAVLALVAAGSIATSARADEEPIDADVGGGAAGIQAAVYVQSPAFNVFKKDYLLVSQVYPRVTLPKEGGAHSAKITNTRVGPVHVKVLFEKISGERSGHPFATAQSILTGITIGTTNFASLDVNCTWDRAGARGSTVVVDAAGNTYEPAANATTEIPGLGTLVLNKQYTEGVWRDDPSVPSGYPDYGQRYFPQVIYIEGAHLYLSQAASDQYGVADVVLGFTSCDPVQLPNLSGVKLVSTPSD